MNVPSLGLEWLHLAATLLAGVLALRLGFWAGARGGRTRLVAATLGTIIALGAAALHFAPPQLWLSRLLVLLGGEGLVACDGGLLLIGIVWSVRGRSTSGASLILASALAFGVMLLLASGPLWWHLGGGGPIHANYPDAQGVVHQTTGATCAPAAASMLLARYGVRVSEGDLAELSGTSPLLGTEAYALGRAVDAVARRHGLRAHSGVLTLDGARRLARPFVAMVDVPGIGGHAILVVQIAPKVISTIDPLSGSPDALSPAEFESEWRHLIVWVEP